jgi:hypothetical protein
MSQGPAEFPIHVFLWVMKPGPLSWVFSPATEVKFSNILKDKESFPMLLKA